MASNKLPAAVKVQCSNCRYFVPKGDKTYGDCCFRAPVVPQQFNSFGDFPMVKDTQFCGDFKEAESHLKGT